MFQQRLYLSCEPYLCLKGGNSIKLSGVVLGVFCVICFGVVASSAEKLYSFKRHIVPVLDEQCYGCHCSIYQFLCTYDSMMVYKSETDPRTKGVPIINIAKPDSSVILWRIRGKLPSGEDIDIMPVGFGKLPDETIDIFRKWIEQGAPETTVDVDNTRRWGEIKQIFR